MKTNHLIPFAIIIGGLIVATAVYFSIHHYTEPTLARAELIDPVSTSDHILGNPAAPVMIVEYADFDCPFCKDISATIQQVIANEPAGKVAWVLREFPLTELHPTALADARAAECAAQTGGANAFFTFADELFAQQTASSTNYGALAAQAGITSNDFASCIANASSTIDARITADRQNALEMGATGTPFAVILANGKVFATMNSDYPYDAVKQIVDSALAQ